MAEPPPGEKKRFKPYVPDSASLPELTLIPLLVGTGLGVLFGASSLYLVLKVGLTVSASIPVAVISITLFRLLAKLGMRRATILENNIVQTAGSAGESIAFGVGVTMPAIMILGFDLEVTRVLLVGVLGGLLGILMMIPLRRALIVEQHGALKYPEGTACAEVLKAGEPTQGGEASSGKTIFGGFAIGLLYKAAMAAFDLWKSIPEKVFGAPLAGGSMSAEISPELLGVGYIIGPRIAATMCGGGVLAYLVLIPLIKLFGGHGTFVMPPGQTPIAEMTPDDVRSAYVLYIGAGAVAAGGIVSLGRSLPTLWHGLRAGLRDVDLRGKKHSAKTRAATPRTERDLPVKIVLIGSIALMAAIVLAPSLGMSILQHPITAVAGALMIVVFGFLFVTVSSRLTGEIGSSSNPISGMTIATLLLTCAIFLVLGWTGPSYYVTALSVGAIVCIAASNGGTTSQDLKTGYLLGGTPRLQQIAILVGSLCSALALGPILMSLNETATVYAPQAMVEPLAAPAPPLSKDDAAALPVYEGSAKIPGAAKLHVLRVPTVPTGPQPTAARGMDPGDYLVEDGGAVDYRIDQAFPADLRVDPRALDGHRERVRGPQASADSHEYLVWFRRDETTGRASKFLVADDGTPAYLVDPGVSGTHTFRPDGSKVAKFPAPTATLMSYIIKGILSQKLPWGLVLLGVMIALVLEMVGIPSLAFAVGVYLPLSSSTPILAGGAIRWLIDRHVRKKHEGKALTEEELVAEGDKSPGVLMASGYIAGGALAGIVIAFVTGGLSDTAAKIEAWATAKDPFFAGPWSDALSLVPFALLAAGLYLVGREKWLAPKT